MKGFFGFLAKHMFGDISGNYGHDNIFRNYIGLPSWVRFNIVIQHGWYGEIYERDLKGSGIYLVWSERIAEEVRRVSSKKVFVLGAPFALFRRMNNLDIKHDAKGTVAFPQHSSPNVGCAFDIEGYCSALMQLSEDYMPITICLHYRDVEAWGGLFQLKGFNVVTAGDSRQGAFGFVENFYDILSSHKYATSNDIGSYLFYSVDMGVPFFLMGEDVSFYNKSTGGLLRVGGFGSEIYNTIFSSFSGRGMDFISEYQAELVRRELGVDGDLEVRYLYYYIIFRFLFIELPMGFPRLLYKGFLKFSGFFR